MCKGPLTKRFSGQSQGHAGTVLCRPLVRLGAVPCEDQPPLNRELPALLCLSLHLRNTVAWGGLAQSQP